MAGPAAPRCDAGLRFLMLRISNRNIELNNQMQARRASFERSQLAKLVEGEKMVSLAGALAMSDRQVPFHTLPAPRQRPKIQAGAVQCVCFTLQFFPRFQLAERSDPWGISSA